MIEIIFVVVFFVLGLIVGDILQAWLLWGVIEKKDHWVYYSDFYNLWQHLRRYL